MSKFSHHRVFLCGWAVCGADGDVIEASEHVDEDHPVGTSLEHPSCQSALTYTATMEKLQRL